MSVFNSILMRYGTHIGYKNLDIIIKGLKLSETELKSLIFRSLQKELNDESFDIKDFIINLKPFEIIDRNIPNYKEISHIVTKYKYIQRKLELIESDDRKR